MTIIGVLALQGDFAEHGTRLEELGAEPRRVRLPEDLDGLDGLIIPGGETTTFDRLLSLYGLAGPVRRLADSGVPVWGTCAGLIALAERVVGRDRPLIGMLDVEVERNAYGRQVDSFETDIDVPALGGGAFHAVFIRAPKIVGIGPGVEVLASLPANGAGGGSAVAVRCGPVLGTAFHPELTTDGRLHAYFLNMTKEAHAAAR